MEAQINNARAKEKIQVYKNDFFSGVLLLTRRLFMF
jgi:hypothetical protein